MNTPMAIALLEFDSLAVGALAADAMLKKAPLDSFRAGSVHPGKYVVLLGGAVAAVEESHREGRRVGGQALLDDVLLPDPHPQLAAALAGARGREHGESLALLETGTIAANVRATDRALKTAGVTLLEMRLGDDLGGKALTHLAGAIADIQAAMHAALAVVEQAGGWVRHAIIPLADAELVRQITRSTHFQPAPKPAREK